MDKHAMKCAAPAYGGHRYQGAAGLEIAIAKAKDKIDRPLRRDPGANA